MVYKKYTAFYDTGKVDLKAPDHNTAKRKAWRKQREYGRLISLITCG